MREWLKSKTAFRKEHFSEKGYASAIEDLTGHEMVGSMSGFIHHGEVSCLDHCLNVSYLSYRICRKLGFDCRSAARGGLLHDFFLYDWHTEKLEEGLHGFVHPEIALRNAERHFHLNDIEKDIIRKHMWPLTFSFPKYRESFVVMLADKYVAVLESFRLTGSAAA